MWGGNLSKNIKIERNIGGRRITFHNVPVTICQNCNEQYLSSKVLKQMDRLLTKNSESDQINYSIDPVEQKLYQILKNLEERDIIPPRNKVDMPISVSDIYYAMDRISKLREEQLYI